MGQEAYDKLWKLIGLRYKSHPWHGIEIGKRTPRVVTSFIEVIPSDTVKYEVDKKTGYLKIDRPQNFLISFLPFMALFLRPIAKSKLLLTVWKKQARRILSEMMIH